jgi:hypothetical protein
MKYLKLLLVAIFTLSFFGCIEENASLMPAADAKVESQKALIGKWNAHELSMLSDNWSVGTINNHAEVESSLTLGRDGVLTVVFKGGTYTGTWELGATSNYFKIAVPTEQLPTYVPSVPENWAVMKSTETELWLHSGSQLIKFRKA